MYASKPVRLAVIWVRVEYLKVWDTRNTCVIPYLFVRLGAWDFAVHARISLNCPTSSHPRLFADVARRKDFNIWDRRRRSAEAGAASVLHSRVPASPREHFAQYVPWRRSTLCVGGKKDAAELGIWKRSSDLVAIGFSSRHSVLLIVCMYLKILSDHPFVSTLEGPMRDWNPFRTQHPSQTNPWPSTAFGEFDRQQDNLWWRYRKGDGACYALSTTGAEPKAQYPY